ncbi:MAG: hypothetical protein KC636_10730, partial [Myxococcales bacterium]|nr:hypothetical protein [Myxococcales bacterium]
AALLAAALVGCIGDETPGAAAVVERAPPSAGCLDDDAAFVHRALLRVQGRAPRGVAETRLLAGYVAQLDAAGLDGRRLLAEGLTDDPRYLLRWSTILEELLQIPRAGPRALPICHGRRHPAGDGDALAAFIRDHDPTADFGAPWGIGDLAESSLRLDDLSPLLRALLLTRVAGPINGNNVSPEELERARRQNFGRSFEATYLGRRVECLACHNGEGSVTDHPDPALDRAWPHPAPLERAVFGDPRGRDEPSLFAAFRYAGFGEGPLAPWGAEGCGGVHVGRGGDLLEEPAYLAGPLPAGATALDVEARLRDGLEQLRDGGPLTDEVPDPAAALATLTALNLVDGAWAALSGARLTLAHGLPRNQAQRDTLLDLTDAFVAGGLSPRALVVELVVHPALNQGTPDSCGPLAGDERAPLPALFDPYAPERDPATPGNGLGDALHPRGGFALLDRLALALEWPTVKRHPAPFQWEDEALMRGLGVRLSETEPGHRGGDWSTLLLWESRVAAGRDPGFAGRYLPDGTDDAAPGRDFIDRLIARGRESPDARFGDLAVAVKDRLLCAPDSDAEEQALVAALVGIDWTTPIAAVPDDALEEALRALVGALAASPEFLLAGLAPPRQLTTPPIVAPGDEVAALCARRMPTLVAVIPGSPTFTCDDDGVTLAWPAGA